MDLGAMYYVTWIFVSGFFFATIVLLMRNSSKVKMEHIKKEKAEIDLKREELQLERLKLENASLSRQIENASK